MNRTVALFWISVDVAAPINVVSERLRVGVRKPFGVGKSSASSWKTQIRPIHLRRLSRGQFVLPPPEYSKLILASIRRRLLPTPSGTSVDIMMFMRLVAWRGVTEPGKPDHALAPRQHVCRHASLGAGRVPTAANKTNGHDLPSYGTTLRVKGVPVAR